MGAWNFQNFAKAGVHWNAQRPRVRTRLVRSAGLCRCRTWTDGRRWPSDWSGIGGGSGPLRFDQMTPPFCSVSTHGGTPNRIVMRFDRLHGINCREPRSSGFMTADRCAGSNPRYILSSKMLDHFGSKSKKHLVTTFEFSKVFQQGPRPRRLYRL